MQNQLTMTNLQLELLKLYSYKIEDNQLLEIKSLLAKYFADKASEGIDLLIDNNLLNDQTVENWANEHLRTSY